MKAFYINKNHLYYSLIGIFLLHGCASTPTSTNNAQPKIIQTVQLSNTRGMPLSTDRKIFTSTSEVRGYFSTDGNKYGFYQSMDLSKIYYLSGYLSKTKDGKTVGSCNVFDARSGKKIFIDGDTSKIMGYRLENCERFLKEKQFKKLKSEIIYPPKQGSFINEYLVKVTDLKNQGYLMAAKVTIEHSALGGAIKLVEQVAAIGTLGASVMLTKRNPATSASIQFEIVDDYANYSRQKAAFDALSNQNRNINSYLQFMNQYPYGYFPTSEIKKKMLNPHFFNFTVKDTSTGNTGNYSKDGYLTNRAGTCENMTRNVLIEAKPEIVNSLAALDISLDLTIQGKMILEYKPHALQDNTKTVNSNISLTKHNDFRANATFGFGCLPVEVKSSSINNGKLLGALLHFGFGTPMPEATVYNSVLSGKKFEIDVIGAK